jgi:transaldolase/glucose-6-phosphate isomerase
MVPAALMGIDLDTVTDRVAAMAAACAPDAPTYDNPALMLGTLLGTAALAGADKLTLLISPSLRPLGAWIEQLIAESTGKEGKGLVPIDGEPPDRAAYGRDRCFAALRIVGDHAPEFDRAVHTARDTGAPFVEIALPARLSLFAEFFKWEVATAVAAALLRVDPFDEPNVQESKDKTRAILDRASQHGALYATARRPRRPPRAVVEAPGAEPTPESILTSLFAEARPGMYWRC